MEQKPQVMICVAHWQVKERIRLCLRAIRKYAEGVPCVMIVADNGWQDEPLDYLRSLTWIRLIERGEQTPESWVKAFTTALDIGLASSRGGTW